MYIKLYMDHYVNRFLYFDLCVYGKIEMQKKGSKSA